MAFEAALARLLLEHYEGHWYPDDPSRGGGYRSLVCDQRQVDDLLERAGAEAGIANLRRYLRDEHHVMFVNPGAVRVRSLAYYNAPATTVFEALREEPALEAAAAAEDAAGETQEPVAAADAPADEQASAAAHASNAAVSSSGAPRSPVYPGKERSGSAHSGEGLSVGA